MALSVSTQAAPVGTKLVVQMSASATPDNSVTGAVGSVFQIDVDNSANADNPAFLKIWDNPAPIVGTDPPDMIVKIPVNQRRSVVIPDGWDFNDLSFACVISGGTAGTVSPTLPVIVKMVTT